MKDLKIVKKSCLQCNSEFESKRANKYCSVKCQTAANQKNQKQKVYDKNNLKYESANPSSYVTCGLCGFKSTDLGTHVKSHNIASEEYKKLYGPTVCEDRCNAMKGKNNPGYNHGGKFSPFSKNFVKYQDLDEKEKENIIAQKYEDNSKFMEENPHRNSTRIEYYLAQGLSEEDAQKALSKRQTTFSLKVCQKKKNTERK